MVLAQLPVLRRLSPRFDPGPRWLQKLRPGFKAHDRRSLLFVVGVLAPLPWLWEVPVIMVAGHALSLSFSPMLAFAMLTAANLGTVVPVPGGAGSFEAAGAFALAAGGVPHDRAFAFVLLYHVSLLLPMVVAGVGVLALPPGTVARAVPPGGPPPEGSPGGRAGTGAAAAVEGPSVSQQRIAPCPVCKKPVEPLARNPSFPFCSDRCRRIDLGRWFGEEYRVPSRSAEGEESPPPPDDAPER